MTGIEYLEHVHNRTHPPILVMSSVGLDDAQGGVRCLELGAFDYIEKPKGVHSTEDIEKIKSTLIQARYSNKKYKSGIAPVENLPPVSKRLSRPDLIAIGASTGGTEALRTILTQLKKNTPPIVIVQHIPEKFSATLASRLNELSDIEICEGKSEQVLKEGTAYIAPGGKQMRIIERNNELFLEINDDERMNLHKPSVDYMFYSIANLKKKFNVCAIILTGMGSDGAKGMKALHEKDAFTIAQNEESSVVFGMPKEAIALGAIHKVADLNDIPNILKSV
jgi:two-component system chemotaxis response regulator CheB